MHGRERDRGKVPETHRGDPGRTPAIFLSPTFSPQGPLPGGPIHTTMSSRSNLGLTVGPVTGYQLLTGRLPWLAWLGWSHGRRHTGNPHSQDGPRNTRLEWGQGDSWGLRGSQSPGKPPKNHPSLWAGYAGGINGSAFPPRLLPGTAAAAGCGSVLPPRFLCTPESPSPGTTGLRITKDEDEILYSLWPHSFAK